MNEDQNEFRLTEEEDRRGTDKAIQIGAYIALALVAVVTGVHAIMLVWSLAPTPTAETGSLVSAIFNVVRLAFPVLMEAAAVVVGVGFFASKWRKTQKKLGIGVEIVWMIFAASNMVTYFHIERGLQPAGMMLSWVNYGLPLSALVAGVLTYMLLKADPNLKRQDEEKAADEKITMLRFAARRDVAISPQRQAIERQRAWIDFVSALRSQGYSEEQIQYMLQDTPELLIKSASNSKAKHLPPAASPVIARDKSNERAVMASIGGTTKVEEKARGENDSTPNPLS